MTNPTTYEATEEQRARAREMFDWLDVKFGKECGHNHSNDGDRPPAYGARTASVKYLAQALAQESAREALAWKTLIKSSIQAGEIRRHLHPVALGAVIAALNALLDEIPKARVQAQEGT